MNGRPWPSWWCSLICIGPPNRTTAARRAPSGVMPGDVVVCEHRQVGCHLAVEVVVQAAGSQEPADPRGNDSEPGTHRCYRSVSRSIRMITGNHRVIG